MPLAGGSGSLAVAVRPNTLFLPGKPCFNVSSTCLFRWLGSVPEVVLSMSSLAIAVAGLSKSQQGPILGSRVDCMLLQVVLSPSLLLGSYLLLMAAVLMMCTI